MEIPLIHLIHFNGYIIYHFIYTILLYILIGYIITMYHNNIHLIYHINGYLPQIQQIQGIQGWDLPGSLRAASPGRGRAVATVTMLGGQTVVTGEGGVELGETSEVICKIEGYIGYGSGCFRIILERF